MGIIPWLGRAAEGWRGVCSACQAVLADPTGQPLPPRASRRVPECGEQVTGAETELARTQRPRRGGSAAAGAYFSGRLCRREGRG